MTDNKAERIPTEDWAIPSWRAMTDDDEHNVYATAL
jgi:hypothetical protein